MLARCEFQCTVLAQQKQLFAEKNADVKETPTATTVVVDLFVHSMTETPTATTVVVDLFVYSMTCLHSFCCYLSFVQIISVLSWLPVLWCKMWQDDPLGARIRQIVNARAWSHLPSKKAMAPEHTCSFCAQLIDLVCGIRACFSQSVVLFQRCTIVNLPSLLSCLSPPLPSPFFPSHHN